MRRRECLDIFRAALAAADPSDAVRRAIDRSGRSLRIGPASYDLADFDRILVTGAGKATARMARAAEEALGDALAGGVIVVKYGHTVPLKKVRQVEAGHPVPDEAGAAGTREIMALLAGADARTLVLCLLSGGGSALLVAPAEGVTLSDKQDATSVLLRAGASIDELNAVRKHLSAVKGGRLAAIAAPAAVATLLLSDVIGDRLDVIASGPTAPDPTTYGDALEVLERYGLTGAVPAAALRLLQRGRDGLAGETPKQGDPCFRTVRNGIVGSLAMAVEAARSEAARAGFDATVVTAELRGEARAAAAMLAERVRRERASMRPGDRPRCLIWGGETTVRVTGGGMGGRNQELALAFAIAIEGLAGVTLLSAGTDGTDGPTDAAGAVVDGNSARAARELRIDPVGALDYNDSYTFFERLDAASGAKSHLKTGPTGTNVMDLQVVVIDGPAEGNGRSA